MNKAQMRLFSSYANEEVVALVVAKVLVLVESKDLFIFYGPLAIDSL